VDNQSFAKAAEQIGLNSSAVSKQLAKLEESLGTQLINRTTRRLALTDAGRYFYERINRIEQDWTDSIDETSSLGKEIRGNLRIAAPEPLFSRFLMPVLAAFQKKYPAISFEMLNHSLGTLPYINADITICRELDNYDSATTVMMPFYSYQNRLFASPKYLQSAGPVNDISQLKDHHCIIYDKKGLPHEWVFEKQSVIIEKTLITNNAEIMISAAKKGLGVVYLPEELLDEELSLKQLVHVLPNLRSRLYKTCAYYPKVNHLPQKVRVFLNFLKSADSFD
jgi:DNA-binding transcriptional LysR family regulator